MMASSILIWHITDPVGVDDLVAEGADEGRKHVLMGKLERKRLERVNPSPYPTHSVRESEWAKAEAVLHAASGCPRGTHLIRDIWIEEQNKDTKRRTAFFIGESSTASAKRDYVAEHTGRDQRELEIAS
uniref:Uncharacterized protein n=1 Tax=Solanum tuberosum TaxID=4113 RepID=M1E048_SOLTU